MAVEKVFTPQSIKQGNPKEAKEQKSVEEGDNTNWPAMAKDSKAMLEYASAQKLLQNLGGGGGESGVKVEGKVNLGDFNLQEQANAAAAQAEQIRQDKDAEVRAEREKREAVEKTLQEERIASIREDMNNKMTELHQSIQKMMEGSSKKGEAAILSEFRENFTTVKSMLSELGMIGGTTETSDLNLQIKLQELAMATAREERQFKREMKADDRRWQIEMQKLQDQRDHNSGLFMLQKQRNEMLANLPKQIGGALASAVASQEAGGIQSAAQGWQLSVEEGGGGEFECPHCAQQGKIVKVAVAPSTTMAVCANCRNTFPIKRKPAAQMPEQTPEEEV